MKKVVVVTSSMEFKNTISKSLNCDGESIELICTRKDFLELVKNIDPILIILDSNYVGKEDLLEYYAFTKWHEIQMIVTNEKNKLNIPFLLN